MRSKLTLLTTAAALAFGLAGTAALAEDAPGADSDVTIAGTDTGDAPAGAKHEAPGAADEGSVIVPDDSGAGGAAGPSSPNASDEGAAGAAGGDAGKSTEDLGAPPAVKPGMKECKLPSPSSSY
jgi:hypothetical protein